MTRVDSKDNNLGRRTRVIQKFREREFPFSRREHLRLDRDNYRVITRRGSHIYLGVIAISVEIMGSLYVCALLTQPGIEMSKIVAANEIRKTLRDVQPSHYIFKIESFSVLLETKTENYQSDVFEVGGYTWKLSFYPTGNKKRNGKDYISLYLVISDTETLTRGWEVNVNLKLFVFDHIRGKYLTIEGKGECLCMTKLLSNKVHTWKVEKFSSLSEEFLYSEEFNIGGRNWNLVLYPKGDSRKVKHEYISLFLEVSLFPKHKLYARFKLRIRDQVMVNTTNLEIHFAGSGWFGPTIWSWGFQAFTSLRELHDKSKGFLVDGTIIIEAEIVMMSVTKNFT
ncbi:uncharacterized protein LOC132295937 [Cornus florida]|uniref:uncharacterized protein LOC132295937 n=1 Tax=Cornus florida TaxID=4283 RepID=UPI0028975E85|nr:uncharacterized protein LOC132295937 [Cornus florida]